MSIKIPVDKNITKRVYEIFQARGAEHGKNLDDWLQPEEDVVLENTNGKKAAATTIKRKKV